MICDSDKILGQTTDWWSAVGTVVNAAVVIVLAFINWKYLRAADKQAKAANTQATEAVKQTSQIKEQVKLTREVLHHSVKQDKVDRRGHIMGAESELRKIRAVLNTLRTLLSEVAPNLEEVSEIEIFPDTWDVIVRCIEQEIPEGDRLARDLQGSLMDSKSEFIDLRNRLRSAMPSETAKAFKEGVRQHVRASLDQIGVIIPLLHEALTNLKASNPGLDSENLASSDAQ